MPPSSQMPCLTKLTAELLCRAYPLLPFTRRCRGVSTTRAQQQETMEFKQDEITFRPMEAVCALFTMICGWTLLTKCSNCDNLPFFVLSLVIWLHCAWCAGQGAGTAGGAGRDEQPSNG